MARNVAEYIQHVSSRKRSDIRQTTWLEIDRGHLLHNLKCVKRLAGTGTGILAVIKANAYGHGLETIAETLAPHVAMFGVTRIQEVLRLKECGIDVPTLVMGPVLNDDVMSVIKTGTTCTISSLREACRLSAEAARTGRIVPVHIKIDTGMGRLGIPYRCALPEIIKIAALSNLRITGYYTHFPSADDAGTRQHTQRQIDYFNQILNALTRQGIEIGVTHASNSSGVVTMGAAGQAMVRPGIMLYGALPNTFKGVVGRLDLRPVMSWRTRIIFAKELAKGEGCGYGSTYVAPKRLRIGLIPVGYSLGYPFALSGKANVLIRGKKYPVVGRVSMDYTAIRLGPQSDIEEGEIVTLIGQDGGLRITVNDLARWAESIPYEIMTQIKPAIIRMVTP